VRRAKLPLDAEASAKANAAIAAECSGPLSMRAADAGLRRKWMDAYQAAGGELEQDILAEEPARSSVHACDTAIEPAPCSAAPPSSFPVGTADYYRKRNEDFQQRHGGPPPKPPAYYLEYGDKYRTKFAALDGGDLSPEGVKWRDCTLKKLQQMIEDKRAADPCGFADLEMDDKAFKRFAFDTHVEAYTSCGLLKLPLSDLYNIGTTPDLKDIFLDWDGFVQVLKVAGKIRPGDVVDIASATRDDVAKATKELVSQWFE